MVSWVISSSPLLLVYHNRIVEHLIAKPGVGSWVSSSSLLLIVIS